MSSLLFISCEQLYTSAGDLILKITNPIEKKFNDIYSNKYAGEKLESIGIFFRVFNATDDERKCSQRAELYFTQEQICRYASMD